MICQTCNHNNKDGIHFCAQCGQSLNPPPQQMRVKFTYICQKDFTELKGESNYQRHCDTCDTEVINLDPLDPEERLKLFEQATSRSSKLCVSVTEPIDNGAKCSESRSSPPKPVPPMRTAGLPKMPTPLEMENERKRINEEKARIKAAAEQEQSENSIISKIKSWLK